MMRDTTWKDHIDKLGIVGNWDSQKRDGFTAGPGDEAQRMGMFAIGFWLWYRHLNKFPWETGIPASKVANPSTALSVLECPRNRGNYRRYHKAGDWTSECDRFTRDQATGVAAAFLAGRLLKHVHKFSNHKKRLLHYMWNMLKRLGFTNNYTKRGLPIGS